MTVKQFFEKYNGKGIDWDQYYGYQCVDLYRQYVHEVLELPQSPGVVGAKDIWKSYLKNHFDAINNDPVAIPKLGDIVIWNKYAGNGYGHVGIFHSGDVNSFVSFDQNWPIGSLCHFQPHNYTNVVGWLRPNKFVDNQPEPIEFTDQTLIPIGGEWGDMELQAVRSTMNDQKRGLESLEGELAECKKDCIKQLTQLEMTKNRELFENKAKWQLDCESANEKYEKLELKYQELRRTTIKAVSFWQFIKDKFFN